MNGTGTSNANMDMIGVKELGSQFLETLGKGRREQQIAMIAVSVCVWES